MSEQKLGYCLPLYLKHRLLLPALEDAVRGAADTIEESKLLDQFRERASEQAVELLGDLHADLVGGKTSAVPYKCDRRSQRRTVKEYWYVEGPLYRPRERLARAYWNLILGNLRDKGPAVAFVIGPQVAASPTAFDDLASQAAQLLGLESANARNCFTHHAEFEAGVVVSFAELASGSTHREVAATMKTRLDAFFAKFRTPLETALNA